jgi:Flp pilus assembly protein TadD
VFLGNCQTNNSNFINEVQKTIKKNEKKLQKNSLDQEAYSKMAISYYKLHQFETAVMYYDKLIAINSKYPGALSNRGMCKLLLKDKQGACNDFRQSILNSENPKVIEGKSLAEYVDAECNNQ